MKKLELQIKLEDQKIVELYDKGYSQKEIAAELNLSLSTIQRRCKKLELNFTKNTKITEEEIANIIELINQRKSLKEIVNITGLSKGTVQRCAKKNELHFHSKNRIKDNKENILLLLSKGKTYEEIAEIYDWNPATIRKFIRNNKIIGKRQKVRNLNLLNVSELHSKGYLIKEIAQELSIHEATVKSCLEELNLTPNQDRIQKVVNIKKLEPLCYYLNTNIKEIEESYRKSFIEDTVYALIKNKCAYVSRAEVMNLGNGITEYYLAKYKVSVPSINLKCGIYKKVSTFEEQIANYLIYNNILFESEKTFDTCRSKKDELLRFDFYLIDYNILIEADGTQHYLEESKFYSKEQKERDLLKDKWCTENNIQLIRIPYKRNAHFEYLKQYLNITQIKSRELRENP